MLVLARRLNEKIILPTIRTTIGIVSLKPTLVRLGIEGPPSVTVLREEVFHRAGVPAPPAPEDPAGARLALPDGALRNRLNTIMVGLALLRGQLPRRGAERLRALLDRVEGELHAVQFQVEAALEAEDGALSPAVPAAP
jgi:carbon storage regulator CsrA